MALTLRAARSTSLGALVAAALVAWALTYALGSDMSAEPGTMGTGLVGFLALWALMMTAMMLPSLAPVTDAYLRTIARDPRPRVRAVRATALVAMANSWQRLAADTGRYDAIVAEEGATG